MWWKNLLLHMALIVLMQVNTPIPKVDLWAIAQQMSAGEACVTLGGVLSNVDEIPSSLSERFEGNHIGVIRAADDEGMSGEQFRTLNILMFSAVNDGLKGIYPIGIAIGVINMPAPFEQTFDISAMDYPVELNQPFTMGDVTILSREIAGVTEKLYWFDQTGEIRVQVTPTPNGDLYRIAFDFTAADQNGETVSARGAVVALYHEDGDEPNRDLVVRPCEEWSSSESNLRQMIREVAPGTATITIEGDYQTIACLEPRKRPSHLYQAPFDAVGGNIDQVPFVVYACVTDADTEIPLEAAI